MKASLFNKPVFEGKVDKKKAKIFPEGALGYLVGPVLALLANSFISSYLLKYYTDVLGLTSWAGPFLVLLQVLSVILVIIGNLVVGKIMNSMLTKAGRARPLVLLSGPFVALALFAIFWFTPLTTDSNHTLVLIMTAVGYNLFYAVGYPIYYTSHSALVGLSTRDSKDRGLLATLSNASTLGAMGACTMILPFFLDKIFNADVVDPKPAYDALRWVALALAIISILGPILEFLFTRERITEEEFEKASSKDSSKETKEEKVTIGKQLKVCVKDKFWWIMIAFFFLYQLGGMLKNCSQLYYCNAFFGNPDGALTATVNDINAAGGAKSGLLAIIGAIPTAAGMVVVWPLSNKIGKGKLIMLGGVLAVVGGVLGLIFPDNFIIAVIAFVIKALGGAPAMYISLALLADVSDHQEAKHGFRCDGLSMAIYGSIMVGMSGIANGIIAGVLSGVGYAATPAGMTSDAVKAAMNWIFFGGETICYAIIAILFIFMGVEKYSKEDQAKLKDNKKVAEAK